MNVTWAICSGGCARYSNVTWRFELFTVFAAKSYAACVHIKQNRKSSVDAHNRTLAGVMKQRYLVFFPYGLSPPPPNPVPLCSLIRCVWVPEVTSFGNSKGPDQANVLSEGIQSLTLGSVKDPGLPCLSDCPSHWTHYNEIAGLCKADLLEHNSP